ncbi:DUF1538 domain-containing protein [Proteocatella sphenisci]|uniref:DUF1538 domain-containing protein n=1 Tax=Proteocatella sphenisci TaxID=181070 RepID=UPI000490D9B3|nr:DUF1538 domain-containing protein [Proteocatella sphenisci]
MNILSEKLREVFFSVLPVTFIVILLKFTLIPLDGIQIVKFLAGTVFVVFGLTLFLTGVDLGITPLGEHLGPAITKRNKLWIVIFAGFVLGFFISFAEPGLLILSSQIDTITSGAVSSLKILVVVSLGIAVMMVLGFLRMLFNLPLYIILNICYFIILLLGIKTSPEFLGIAFDASGSTTGVLAVPFILALSLGITSRKKDSKSSEKDSFGLVSIVSVGAVMSVMLINVFGSNHNFTGELKAGAASNMPVIETFAKMAPDAFKDSIVAFFPLVVIFIVMNVFAFSLSSRERRKMSFGFIYGFIGLFLFFIGVNAGFMEIGTVSGSYLATMDNGFFLVATGFVLGVVTILAEPAVHVLTHQIETVTAGYVRKKSVLFALSSGVGLAVALSMIRILVPQIQLWHYLLPGYALALALTFIVPKLFVGIAFDAGGVATGPITATFILAFTHGAANARVGADLLVDGFGMIAMVALMPIITLQILGLVFKMKTKKNKKKKDVS